jgi:hypothetical protein
MNNNKKWLSVIAFLLIAFYRQFYLFGKSGSEFVGDEIQWNRDLTDNNLKDYLGIKDAGYFVFVSRLLFYIFVKSIGLTSFELHIVIVIIGSLSCASIIYLFQENSNNIHKFLVALVVGLYPTYDLLFWHNLSYFIFIPTLLITVNLDKNNRYFTNLGLIILFVWVAKPQLLISLALVIFAKSTIYFIQKHKIDFSILYIFLTLLLFIISRSDNSLPLQFTIKNFINLFFNFLYIPISLFTSVISAGLVGFLKMNDLFIIELIVKLILSCTTIMLTFLILSKYFKLDKIPKLRLVYFLSAATPIYLSFFVFKDSVFSNILFFDINCRSCVMSRHIFPLYTIILLFIISIFRNFRFLSLFIISQIFQSLVLVYYAYEYLFSAVLRV